MGGKTVNKPSKSNSLVYGNTPHQDTIIILEINLNINCGMTDDVCVSTSAFALNST